MIYHLLALCLGWLSVVDAESVSVLSPQPLPQPPGAWRMHSTRVQPGLNAWHACISWPDG